MNYADIPNVTSLLELADGRLPLNSLDGQPIAPCGPDHVRANLSAQQAKGLGLLTSGTYGPPGSTSLISAILQRFLESRLLASGLSRGSTLYTLTWKVWDTPSGVSRFRLRASALPSSGTASTGARVPRPSGTSNHGKNHVAGRLDEWGGSSNPFRGTNLGRVHSPAFEFWMMGYPVWWQEQMRRAMRLSRSKPSRS